MMRFCFSLKYNSSDTGLVPKIVKLKQAATGRSFKFKKKSCSNPGKCCMKVELYGHRSGKSFNVFSGLFTIYSWGCKNYTYQKGICSKYSSNNKILVFR